MDEEEKRLYLNIKGIKLRCLTESVEMEVTLEKSLKALKDEFLKIAEKIRAPQKYVFFHELRRDDGSNHVELKNGIFYYVGTDRGQVTESRFTSDPEEILYWLTSDLIFAVALDYEKDHRVKNQDPRRIFFQRQLDLLNEINPEWAEKKKEELKAYNFNDAKEPRHI